MKYRLPLSLLLICLSLQPIYAEEFAVTADPRNSPQGRKCDLAIACVFQNEMPWLREWIEFHRMLGVTHFYLYNNNSQDKYLDVLNPYVESGVVELYDFTGPLPGNQEKIYEHALSLAKGPTRWVAMIDTDEFIVPLVTDNLVKYLSVFSDDVGGVEINWQCFGTSDVWSILPGELLIEKLTWKAIPSDPMNYWQKSIVRPEAVLKTLQHHCSYLDGYRVLRVNPIDPRGMPLDEASMQAIRIHHYILRTKEFFYKVKQPRIKSLPRNMLRGRTPSVYLETTNAIEDRSILRYVPRLKQILSNDPLIHPHGYWMGKESTLQHRFDPALALMLIDLFTEEEADSIVDFGCGMGDYVWAFRKAGFSSFGLDGNPHTAELTKGSGLVVDLAQPLSSMKKSDWGIALAVGDSLAPDYEDTFLKNISQQCTNGLILCWPGFESGYEAKEKNRAISQKLEELGFIRDEEREAELKKGVSLATFRHNLMVFRK